MNMKRRVAKQLIIKEYNKLTGLNMVATMDIEDYLVSEVQLGKVTPKEAAKTSHINYENMCTRIFEAYENN